MKEKKKIVLAEGVKYGEQTIESDLKIATMISSNVLFRLMYEPNGEGRYDFVATVTQ